MQRLNNSTLPLNNYTQILNINIIYRYTKTAHPLVAIGLQQADVLCCEKPDIMPAFTAYRFCVGQQ